MVIMSVSLLTSVSWYLCSRPILVRQTGTGLGYGVVWNLRHGGVCIWNCRKQNAHRHKKKLSLGELHMLNYNDLFSATPRITFIIFWYIFCVGRRLSLRVLKVFHRQRWKHKKRKDNLASVCETRQYPCPAVKNKKKRAHIYISSSFSKHSDSHFQHWHIHESVGDRHTHTAVRTRQCTHLQYTYNTLRHGRMRVK